MSMFSAALWIARASRVLVMTSSASRTSSCGALSKPSRMARKFVSARRRNQHARRARSPVTDSGEALVWGALLVLRSAVQWVLV